VATGTRKGEIVRIEATEYFTKKTFIPSPDGGIYDIGFGVFLGPLNESVNSLVNMLLDAGTMQTTAGGFLGRGAKIRGGTYNASPFEWKRVDCNGDDLRKSMVQFPVNAPSDVLFQLLSLLINYANRIAGTTDMMVGENPGQNTPASTAQTMVEMGQKIYSAIFKRIWRSSKEEFQKLFKLNGIFLPLDQKQPGGATKVDYLGSSKAIAPVADPNITSESMAIQLAGAVKAAAATTPGYDHDEVEKKYLTALRVDNIAKIFPGTKGQPPAKDPKVALQEAKDAGAIQRLQMQLQADQQEFAMTLMEERRVNNAKIIELMAKAENESANAQTEQAYAQVALINVEISKVKAQNENLNTRIEHLLRATEIKSAHQIGMKGAATGEEKAA
jgi:chaperonin GroES